MTRRSLACDHKASALPFVIRGVGKRVTVDRGIVVRGDSAGRHDRFGEKPPRRIGQGHALYTNNWTHPRLENGKRLMMRKPVLVEDEAIVVQAQFPGSLLGCLAFD